jgi:hypothetical protein
MVRSMVSAVLTACMLTAFSPEEAISSGAEEVSVPGHALHLGPRTSVTVPCVGRGFVLEVLVFASKYLTRRRGGGNCMVRRQIAS